MNFTKVVPSLFYTDISDGLKLFVDCLQFAIEHKDLKSPPLVLQSIRLFNQTVDWKKYADSVDAKTACIAENIYINPLIIGYSTFC